MSSAQRMAAWSSCDMLATKAQQKGMAVSRSRRMSETAKASVMALVKATASQWDCVLTELLWHQSVLEKTVVAKMSLFHAFVRLCLLILLVPTVAVSHASGPAPFFDGARQCEDVPSHHPERHVSGNCCEPTLCAWVFPVLPVLPVLPDAFAFQLRQQSVGIHRPFVVTRSLYPPPKPGPG